MPPERRSQPPATRDNVRVAQARKLTRRPCHHQWVDERHTHEVNRCDNTKDNKNAHRNEAAESKGFHSPFLPRSQCPAMSGLRASVSASRRDTDIAGRSSSAAR